MAKKMNKTYTKKLTRNMLIISTIGGFTPYMLSFFGKEPVGEVGIAWITAIAAMTLGYFVRGFKDTRSEKDCEDRSKWLEHIMNVSRETYGSNVEGEGNVSKD